MRIWPFVIAGLIVLAATAATPEGTYTGFGAYAPAADEQTVEQVGDNAGRPLGRIRYLHYVRQQTVEVYTKVGFATVIRVPEDIQNIAVGDAALFTVEAKIGDRLVMVKPLHPEVSSDFFIFTPRITYVFKLIESHTYQPDYLIEIQNADNSRALPAGQTYGGALRLLLRAAMLHRVAPEVRAVRLTRPERIWAGPLFSLSLHEAFTYSNLTLFALKAESKPDAAPAMLEPREFTSPAIRYATVTEPTVKPGQPAWVFLVSDRDDLSLLYHRPREGRSDVMVLDIHAVAGDTQPVRGR